MDFELHYTQEQEEFRKEVSEWLDANMPLDFEPPEDPDDVDPDSELYKSALEFRYKLGEKGWFTPTWPREYGGGGLSVDHAIIIAEELAKRPNYDMGDNGNIGVTLFAPAIMIWGTEEQKKRLLPLLLKGKINVWQGYTEPEAGSDLAALKTTAIRQGDEYILNGEKVFLGTKFPVDYIFTLAVTDPNAPRHHNIGSFMVPANLPGIKIEFLPILSYEVPGKRHVYFDNVRVPAICLVGGETDGWQMTQTSLELEHGAGGVAVQHDRLFERVVAYCNETKHNGQPLSKDPDVRQALVEIYIQNEIKRLFELRNYWMRHAKKSGVGYEGSQTSLQRKTTLDKSAALYHDVLGPSVLIKDPKYALLKGALEFHQQSSLSNWAAAGSIEILKLVMARRMGIARTKEKAAAIV